MDFIVSTMDDLEDQYKISAIYNMKTLGDMSVTSLTKHRKLLEDLKETATLKDGCEQCINLIEGRRFVFVFVCSVPVVTCLNYSLAAVHQEVQEQKNEIGELDDRLDEVEDDVEKLGQDVIENKDAIAEVKQDVDEQGERLDELEEVVDETVDKVEELDHKVRERLGDMKMINLKKINLSGVDFESCPSLVA
eukprot:GHVO01002732.1.p1 GENE.GHVO01002732.1~~GHVO01002732.1.p1  ORF type:complete len:192 (-),score=36.49 GHVO01002732.1:125-700(-)